MLPQRVIADAIAASSQLEQVQEELKLAVDEVRDRHIQMQKQILERDRRISYLEQLLAQHGQRTQKQEPELPKIFLFPSTTWEYFALLCGHNRFLLWGAIKDWSASERAKLPPLLAAHLEEKPDSLNEVLAWVVIDYFSRENSVIKPQSLNLQLD